MSHKLKNPNGAWPPSGFPFTDSRTGMKFDGMSADIKLQSLNIIQHRKANPKVYSVAEPQWFNVAMVRQEVVDQICNNNPHLCHGMDAPSVTHKVPKAANVVAVVPAGKKCYKCGGTEFSPILCRTCGGGKVKGYTCLSCGTPNSK